MDAALQPVAAGEVGGPAVPVADVADVLAELSSQTPQAEVRLAAALEAMEAASAAEFRTVIAPAARAERLADELGRHDLHLRARLIRADVLRRQGYVAESGRIAHEINVWATESRHRYLLARSHRLLSMFFRHIGDLPDSLAHAVQSVAYTDDEVPARVRARHLCALAVALDECGSFDEGRRRNQEALDIATAVGDAGLALQVLNNMAYAACKDDDRERAQNLVDQMRAIESRRGVMLNANFLDTIARVEMMYGRYAEAEATLRPILGGEAGHLIAEGDSLAECLLTVAEAQRLHGDIESAHATLDRAVQVCDARSLGSVRAKVREERAKLYAAADRYREAYEEYRLFCTEVQALQSAQSEARARTLQAVFETTEARRASERFREMAQRDPLTGLHNRRFVDERLVTLLARTTELGAPLSVAMIDVDHFKHVNDALSHATGDEVLQQVAALLADAATDPAVAARLGGEEFLLIFPGLDAVEAERRCERLRQDVAAYPWRPVTGEIPVTVSIGITAIAGGDTTPSALLAQADRNLYAAKRAGRNRLVTDPA